MNQEEHSSLAVFEGRTLHKTFHAGEWWFSVIDVIEALVGGIGHASIGVISKRS